MPDQDLSLDIEEVWRDAIKAYKQDTGHDPVDGILKTKIATVDDLGEFIEAQGTKFKDFRSKHEKVYRRIQKCLQPIAILAGPTTEVAKTTNAGLPVGLALGAVAHLVNASKDVSKAYDWIEEVFAELDDFVQQLSEFLKTTMEAPMKRRVAYIMTFIIRIIGRAEHLVRQKRFIKYLHVTFLGEDSETKTLIEQLNRAMQNAEGLAVAVTYVKTHEIAKKVTENGNAIGNVLDQQSQMQSTLLDQQAAQRMEKMFRTNAFKATGEEYVRNKRTILDGTGSWLQEETLFKTWTQRKALILWVLGGPGSGKTMLCTWLTDYLIGNIQNQDDKPPKSDKIVHVAYFFINQDDKDLRSIDNLLRTMAWQIQESDLAFRDHIARTCQSSHKVVGPEQVWRNCFLDYYGSSKCGKNCTILVIDGLDEMLEGDRDILLTLLDQFRNDSANSSGTIQFAIFGRETLRYDLQKAGLESDRHVIKVSADKNRRDLELYIKVRVQKLRVIEEMKRSNHSKVAEFSKQLRKQVFAGAEGVFLWASMILDRMQNKEAYKIREILASPRLTLDNLIYSEFERFNTDEDFDIEDTAQVLLWVSGSKRPLLFGELQFILRLDDLEIRWLLWKNLRGKFASVLELIYPRGYDPDKVRDGFREEGDGAESTNDADSTIMTPATTDSNNDASSSNTDDSDSDFDDSASGATSLANLEQDERDALQGSPTYSDTDPVERYYNSSQLYTIVAFPHARFRDVVQAQTTTESNGKDVLPIFANIQYTDYNLFLQCIKIMQVALREGSHYQNMYLDYPTNNIFLHLESIPIESLNADQRWAVWNGLNWLLRKSQGGLAMFLGLDFCGPKCDDFWTMWYVDKRAIAVTQSWFQAIPAENTDAMSVWMRQAATSTKILLQPLAIAAAKMWLEKRGYDDIAYLDKSEYRVSFLWAYITMSDEGVVSEDSLAFVPSMDLLPKLSATELINLAEWANLEKTTHWYAGVGWILFQLGHHDEGLDYCQRAIDLDSGAWLPMEGRAHMLGKQGDYAAAIEQMNQAIRAVPKPLEYITAYLIGHCAPWKQALGEKERDKEMLKEAWYDNPEAWPAINGYIKILIEEKDSREFLYVMQVMDNIRLSHESTKLVDYLAWRGFSVFLRQACREFGKPMFITEAAEAAMAVILKGNYEPQIVWLMRELALLYYEYDNDDAYINYFAAAAAREKAGGPELQEAVRNSQGQSVKYRVEKYAQVCFDMAVAHRKNDGRGSNKAAKLLFGLASIIEAGSIEDLDSGFYFYTADYPALLWGRWQREYANEDTKVWKKCFRSRILKLLAGLDDEDPTNDIAACATLAITFFQAGEEQIAREILAVLYKPLDEGLQEQRWLRPNVAATNEQKSTSVEPPTVAAAATEQTATAVESPASAVTQVQQTSSEGTSVSDTTQQVSKDILKLHLQESPGYTCDVCGKEAQEAGSMWFCEICYDTNFCTECLTKVKENSLVDRWCNPLHKWYQAWPIPEGIFEKMAHSQDHGLVVLRKDWLENVRRRWLIDAIVAEP